MKPPGKSRWTNYANTFANVVYLYLTFYPPSADPLLVNTT
jgi:hypothetical protein